MSSSAGHSPAPGQRGVGAGASARVPICDMLEAQGLPADHLKDSPLTDDGKRKLIGNAVPLTMGRANRRACGASTDRDRRAMRPTLSFLQVFEVF